MKIESSIAANRFGLGARPGDLDKIEPRPQAWLLDQIQGPSQISADIRALPDSSAVLREVAEVRREQRSQQNNGSDEPAPDVVEKYGKVIRKYYIEQAHARYRAATTTDYGSI